MPYQPIPNPIYYHWEPWPHVYRRGKWINNVTGQQKAPRSRVVAPGFAGLGEVNVPWQCWDTPGFKDCQNTCFQKAQAANLSKEAATLLVDQCFATSCVEPCKARIVETPTKTDDTTKSINDMLYNVTPMKIAIAAIVVAVGATMLHPRERGRR